MPKLLPPPQETPSPVPKAHWEVRLRLLQSKIMEFDGTVKPLEARLPAWRCTLKACSSGFGKSLWLTVPLYLFWAVCMALAHAHQYGAASLLHSPFIYLLACGNLFALFWNAYIGLLLGIIAISPSWFPEALFINPTGFAFGDSKRIIAWEKVQLVRTSKLLYGRRRHSTVLELYLEDHPYARPLSIREKIQEHFKTLALKRNLQYVELETKKYPDNPYEGVCLRLPLELFGFDADCQKFLKAIRDHVRPEALQDDLTLDSTASDGQSFTALWLDELRSPQSAGTSRLLKMGHRLQDGHYTLTNVLGYGGFSVVYGAQSTLPWNTSSDGQSGQGQGPPLPLAADNRVAIKEVMINSGGSRASKEAILRQIVSEIDLLKTLDHPNIVKCLDFFIEGGRVYIVMQALEGQNLRDFVGHEGGLPERDLIEIGLQCCSILTYLHRRSKPLMHRDFTPDNLIWDGKSVKLVDFNVAEEANTTSSPTIVGKHSYLAPEQWCGHFTEAGDLYQLGCSLYFLATANDPEPLSQSDPASAYPDLSSGFCSIVRNLTEQEAINRCATASNAARQLQALREV